LLFAPGYVARAARAEALPAFVHVHAALFSLFMLLVVAQTAFVAADRVALHRKLGLLTAALIPVMLVLGWETMIFGARRGHPPLEDARASRSSLVSVRR